MLLEVQGRRHQVAGVVLPEELVLLAGVEDFGVLGLERIAHHLVAHRAAELPGVDRPVGEERLVGEVHLRNRRGRGLLDHHLPGVVAVSQFLQQGRSGVLRAALAISRQGDPAALRTNHEAVGLELLQLGLGDGAGLHGRGADEDDVREFGREFDALRVERNRLAIEFAEALGEVRGGDGLERPRTVHGDDGLRQAVAGAGKAGSRHQQACE